MNYKVSIIMNKGIVEYNFGVSFTEDNTNTGKKIILIIIV